MPRLVLALVLLLALPVPADARPGDPDRGFARRGTATLKAEAADAVAGAVKVLAGNSVLAGGAASGQFVVVKLRRTGSLDRRFGTDGQIVPALPGSSLEGVRSLAVFRDGRIVAAGTLRLADGTTRMAVLRLLPTGEIDPSFGGGSGYVLTGHVNGRLGAMVMDRGGNIILGGSQPGAGGAETPIVARLLPDGSTDAGFASGGTFAASTLGLGGRVTGLLVRADGPISFTTGGTASTAYPATFSVVRLQATGAPDPTFGGAGVANVALGSGSAAGVGAQAIAGGPNGRVLVAGTDLSPAGTPRGVVIRLRPDGGLDTRFGGDGVSRIARASDEIRITAMTRDNRGRILVSGSGRPPHALVARLRGNGARDKRFGNGGLTFPLLGRPPGGEPIYTTLDAIDAAGSRPILAGSAAGPGTLTRGFGGATYTGRFALTVSKLQ
jgi:uncharacterized delta-60 repeat protein